MGKNFEYEWWTVSIRYPTGTCTTVFKGKDKDHIIKRIKMDFAKSNSPENLARTWCDPKRKDQMLEIYWDTLKFDRKGYHVSEKVI